MVNSTLLKQIIKEKGIKMEVLAKNLGISTTSVKSKIEGRTDFKSCEIRRLKIVLGLTISQIGLLFFADECECQFTFQAVNSLDKGVSPFGF